MTLREHLKALRTLAELPPKHLSISDIQHDIAVHTVAALAILDAAPEASWREGWDEAVLVSEADYRLVPDSQDTRT